jgi:HlyD family secretion protein
MKRPTLIAIGLIGLMTLTAGAVYTRRPGPAPSITAEAVTRGSVVSVVSATGTLEAVTTVQVGTQVSGSIQSLHADFNAIVRKGQVLARLDPSLFQSAIESAEANLIRAEADEQRMNVALADSEVKLQRARELSARELIPATELDTADVTRRSNEAQVKSAKAQVAQARAALEQARVNLNKTIITSPIDGIVIARNVDVGQTVAASLQAPTLFVLAADLTQMQLRASVDEADLGRIHDGQPVRFTVDAYPRETFTGVVRQVRLNPTVESNVVTYAAIVSAANPELKLKPGMTANLSIEIARRDNVLRVPAAALRFRPTAEVQAALGVSTEDVKGTVVWQQAGNRIEPVAVRAGISDGVVTEIAGSALEEGAQVITRAAIADGTAQGTAANPLIPSRPSWR